MKKILIALCAIAAFAVSVSAQMVVADDMKPRAKAVPDDAAAMAAAIEDEVASCQERLVTLEAYEPSCRDSILVSEYDYENLAYPRTLISEFEGMIDRQTPVGRIVCILGVFSLVLLVLTGLLLLFYFIVCTCGMVKDGMSSCGCMKKVKGKGDGSGCGSFRETVGGYLLPFTGSCIGEYSFYTYVRDADGMNVLRFSVSMNKEAVDRIVGLLNGTRTDRFPAGTFRQLDRVSMGFGDGEELMFYERLDDKLNRIPSDDAILFMMNRLQENWTPWIEDYEEDFVDPGDAPEHVDDYIGEE